MEQRQRILFIDAYDSFSNNLISLLETELDVSVEKISIHTPFDARWLASFSAVMIGPGPGNPYEENDIGCVRDIWRLTEDSILPVLGICLGFQSLVVSFGGQVRQLPIPRHGIVTPVTTCGSSIFHGLAQVDVVQYHSLHGIIDNDDTRSTEDLWSSSPASRDLVPLAWDVGHEFSASSHHPEDERPEVDRLNPPKILMGVAHASKPFYGVQFHPESICSSPEAHRIIVNWWNLAQEWNNKHDRLAKCRFDYLDHGAPRITHGLGLRRPADITPRPIRPLSYYSERLTLGSKTIPTICGLLKLHQDSDTESVILDSEMKRTADLSKYSIIGLVLEDTLKTSYKVGSDEVVLQYNNTVVRESLLPHRGRIFDYLKTFMAGYQILPADRGTPFSGGLMGFISYEACLETIEVTAPPLEGRPDVMFAFIERSVIINHDDGYLLVQSIRSDDEEWVQKTTALLATSIDDQQGIQANGIHANGIHANGVHVNGHGSNGAAVSCTKAKESVKPPLPSIHPPEEAQYCQKIRECQNQIRQGNTYELCFTDQTRILCQGRKKPAWDRYQRLRQLNPATFGAYIRLGPLTLLSSSPERFMSWSAPDSSHTSICQFRPIKGTVKKVVTHPDGSKEHVDLKTATGILSTPKERAENLMIVDLIRHDLAGVVGSGNVHVRSLMQVEEYEHVYQLVTVIEGVLVQHDLPKEAKGVENHASGIDVLAASLPPGSMTGAPKKRSCELLRAIEGPESPRSVYSGVLGYMDVCGGGDFSVIIRTAYRWDDQVNEEDEVWSIGAGGAITDMSTEEGEWEEMYAKLDCALGLFKEA
jgi:para-aminobenzoate synthetase